MALTYSVGDKDFMALFSPNIGVVIHWAAGLAVYLGITQVSSSGTKAGN